MIDDGGVVLADSNAILVYLARKYGGETADIACYTYIAHAPEGNVSLADYGQVRAWLARIEALPGFVAMQATAAGLVGS